MEINKLSALHISDLLKKSTKVDWVVEPFLPPGTSNLLAGWSGIGKTWLMLDLDLCIATGASWLGRFKVKQGPVLIVDEENWELLLNVRLSQLVRARGIKDTKKLPVHFLIGQAMDFTPRVDKHGALIAPAKFDHLVETVKEIKPVLVMFESLTRVHHVNENAANEISQVFEMVKRLIALTGTTCLFSHHIVRGTSGSGRSGDRIRGSSDIRAFCDTTILVDACKEGLLLTHDKTRWSEPVEPFKVKFEGDGDKFSIKYLGVAPQKVGVDCWEWIEKQLKGGPKSRAQLQDAAKGIFKERRLDDELARHRDNGDLVKQTKNREAVYSLATLVIDELAGVLRAANRDTP